MSADVATNESSQKRWMSGVGYVMTGLASLALLLSGAAKLSHAAPVVQNFTQKFGFSESVLSPLGVVEMSIAILYLIPRTAVLGAILITGYFGGAIATHVRIGDPSGVMPGLLAMLAWGGIFFRDSRIRALLPLRQAK